MDARYVTQRCHSLPIRPEPFFVQAFEGRENGIEYFPVIVQARHFGPPWIGWELALAAIGSTTFESTPIYPGTDSGVPLKFEPTDILSCHLSSHA
jgi:hypothetical protein